MKFSINLKSIFVAFHVKRINFKWIVKNSARNGVLGDKVENRNEFELGHQVNVN